MSNTKEDTQNNEWKERELGALWIKNGRSGDFFSGHISHTTIDGKRLEVVGFRNKNKTSERAPDYILYKSKPLDQNAMSQKTPLREDESKESSASDEVPALLQ